MSTEQVPTPNARLIEAFWLDARVHARLNELSAYGARSSLDILLPPAEFFGGTPQVATELADLIVAGSKTATAGALWDYQAAGEELPRPGDLTIVVDGLGEPRALIATTQVRTVPFDEVDAEHAAAEGEGDGSLDHWRSVHQEFFTAYAAHEHGFSPTMPVVLQRFRVLYFAAAGRA